MCQSYDADNAVVGWRADNNPLSNFYICTMEYGDYVFMSSEQFYQYEFCMFMDRNDIAQKVLNAASPGDAKQVAAQLKSSEYSTNLAKWVTIKVFCYGIHTESQMEPMR